MAVPVSSRCCLGLNLSPPPPNSSPPSSLPTKTTAQVTWRIKKERSWRSQCVLGLASVVVIGLEILDPIASNNATEAIAVVADQNMHYLVVESNDHPIDNGNIIRWSDKRMCPPWRSNSLEIIVPENLPRLSARWRWEAIGYSRDAPAVKVVITVSTVSNNSCFTT